ncbi:MAG: hypothetical protein ACKO3T_26215, partial [Planctomycetaceae bacterium]
MSECALPQGPEDPQADDQSPVQPSSDSLIWWLRAIDRCRWLCLLVLAIGLLSGFFAAWNAPRYQTTAVLRLSSEAVSYQQTAYWQARANTVAVQLRAWAYAADSQAALVVKPESIPWMLRIEILHPESGAGKQLLERLLNRLRTVQADASGLADRDSQGQTLAHSLQSLMNQFQQQLFQLQRQAGLPTGLAEAPAEAGRGQGLLAHTDTQLPYWLLPHVHRYQQLMLSADHYFSAMVGESGDVSAGPEQLRLLEIQHLLAQRLLTYRGSLDLMRVALQTESAV